MPWICASAPLACSMHTRLLRAPWSCSVSSSPRRMARSWSSPMVATSASAWTICDVGLGHAAGRGAEDVEGSDHLPGAVAAGTRGPSGTRPRRRGARSCGHRSASARSALTTAFPVRSVLAGALLVLDLEQLKQLRPLVGGRHELEPAVMVGEQRCRPPRPATSSDVRVVTMCRNSIRSNSSTRVSATSTSTSASLSADVRHAGHPSQQGAGHSADRRRHGASDSRTSRPATMSTATSLSRRSWA